MANLPVRKLIGVGKINEQILLGMGIEKCGQILNKAIDIYINFTENAFEFLLKSGLGIAKNTHDDTGIKKSVNVSKTFAVTGDYDQIKKKMEELCDELAQRASQEKLKGRTITIEVKNEKFKNKQRSFT
jgi:nucleotidyltransferase/DNA polymerase involved in DNA repair